MNRQRSCGVLLHPTSLPGGRLGKQAYRFVDWLVAAGQSWWQVLPLGPPDAHGSPYNSISAFACSAALLAQPRARVTRAAEDDFRERHRFWLDHYVRAAGRGALADQVRFEREWGALRGYANARGVRLLGDVPIFVSRQSVDVRAQPDLFLDGVVAGVPPDLFTAHGQLWGSALYDWAALRHTGYRWWVERFRRMLALVDLVRVDHFRGFVSYWAVPERHRTARYGQWRRGPGFALFATVRNELGSLPLVAEDLGVITPAVDGLRLRLGVPGTRVIQFGLAGRRSHRHRPRNVIEDAVVYTGTHDNDTAIGWFHSLSPAARKLTGLDPGAPHWDLIRTAYATRARLAIVPAQDPLGLPSSARMNFPGTARGNWRWRLREGQLTDALAARLREEAEAAGRLPVR
jgi:4-alpha-glucanotransferase